MSPSLDSSLATVTDQGGGTRITALKERERGKGEERAASCSLGLYFQAHSNSCSLCNVGQVRAQLQTLTLICCVSFLKVGIMTVPSSYGYREYQMYVNRFGWLSVQIKHCLVLTNYLIIIMIMLIIEKRTIEGKRRRRGKLLFLILSIGFSRGPGTQHILYTGSYDIPNRCFSA